MCKENNIIFDYLIDDDNINPSNIESNSSIVLLHDICFIKNLTLEHEALNYQEGLTYTRSFKINDMKNTMH